VRRDVLRDWRPNASAHAGCRNGGHAAMAAAPRDAWIGIALRRRRTVSVTCPHRVRVPPVGHL